MSELRQSDGLTFRELEYEDGWPFPYSRSIGLFNGERRIYMFSPSEARDFARRLLDFAEGMEDRRQEPRA